MKINKLTKLEEISLFEQIANKTNNILFLEIIKDV